MRTTRARRALPLLLILPVLAACGPTDASTSGSASPTATSTAPAATTSAAPSASGARSATTEPSPSASAASAASTAEPVAGPPQTEAPTSACATMDAVVAEAIAQSPEGQAFTAAQAAGAGGLEAWESVASALDTTYRPRLAEAAGSDTQAQGALEALDTYATVSAGLRAGDPPEFLDPQAAQDAIKTGQEPEVNPAFQEAVTSVTDAHVTLSQCLPSWPVVF